MLFCSKQLFAILLSNAIWAEGWQTWRWLHWISVYLKHIHMYTHYIEFLDQVERLWLCLFRSLLIFISLTFLKPLLLSIGPFSLRLAPYLEPSSTMVALEWTDVEPLIGCKVSDYIIQHKRVEDPSEAEIYTGRKITKSARCFALGYFGCWLV